MQIEQLLERANFSITLIRKGLLDTEGEISSKNDGVLVMECNSHFLILFYFFKNKRKDKKSKKRERKERAKI